MGATDGEGGRGVVAPSSRGSRASAPQGLTTEQVRARRERDGPNVIPAARPEPAVLQLVRQMVHFFALTLWVAAGLALLGGMPQLAVAIAVVVLNGVFAVVQEYRARACRGPAGRAAATARDCLVPGAAPAEVAAAASGS